MSKKKKPNIAKDIRSQGTELKELMREQLAGIADAMIAQVMGAARGLPPSQRQSAVNNITAPGIQEYTANLLDAMALISLDALDQARKEVPAAKKVRLADNIDRLPPALRDKLKKRSQLLIGKQVGDLQNIIKFAYLNNEDTTDSDDQVEQDIKDSALGWLDGPALQAGAEITSATIINQTREAFFWDDDVLEEIDAFEFVNGDPVTPICQDLAGTIFAKDDPNAFRYTPPLHWNCKSYIVPILKGNLGDRETEKLRPSKASLEDQIQFAHRCESRKGLIADYKEWYRIIKTA